MARRNVKRTNHTVTFIRVEAEHDGKVRLIGYAGDNREVVLHVDIANCYGLLTGMRVALKKARNWLDTLESQVNHPIDHSAAQDRT